MKDNPKNNRKSKSSGDGPYWVYALYRDGVAIAQIGCGPCTRREAEKHVPGILQEAEFEFDPSNGSSRNGAAMQGLTSVLRKHGQ
jgi:hypothetical protein